MGPFDTFVDNFRVFTTSRAQVGKIPVNVAQLGVDLLTVAGHKLYAPKGQLAGVVSDELLLSCCLSR